MRKDKRAGRFRALVQFPNAGRVLGGQAHLFQLGWPTPAQCLELRSRRGRLLAELEETGISFWGLTDLAIFGMLPSSFQ